MWRSAEILGRVTPSLGVASLQESEALFTLYERADKCLYAAKKSGRNQVVNQAGLAQHLR